MNFEPIIGLETHVELLTKSKIFCSCENSFGGEPNSKCCEVCMGHPGALPHLNHEVVLFGAMAGLSFGSEINNYSYMARKNYIYPDLPKAYQITQGEVPLCIGGSVTLTDGRRIRIERIHIEEDAGKLIKKDGKILIDYNRAGVPLIEIVTKPDFATGEEVAEYLTDLALTMKRLGISDCKMQEGSLRCDVNISLKDKVTGKISERVEIKNVNSFSFIKKAIDYEAKRLASMLEEGKEIVRETRRFNSETGATEAMRGKESASDYRYFTEPDIPSVYISESEISALKENLPPLPREKKMHYASLGISMEDAFTISKYKSLSIYFDSLLSGYGDAVHLSKIILSSAFKFMDEETRENGEILPTASDVLYVLSLMAEGKIEKRFDKKIFDKMFEERKPFTELFNEEDFAPISYDELIKITENVISGNEKAISDFLKGKEKAIAPLIGKIMKETKGRADAKKAEEALKEIICSRYKS